MCSNQFEQSLIVGLLAKIKLYINHTLKPSNIETIPFHTKCVGINYPNNKNIYIKMAKVCRDFDVYFRSFCHKKKLNSFTFRYYILYWEYRTYALSDRWLIPRIQYYSTLLTLFIFCFVIIVTCWLIVYIWFVWLSYERQPHCTYDCVTFACGATTLKTSIV